MEFLDYVTSKRFFFFLGGMWKSDKVLTVVEFLGKCEQKTLPDTALGHFRSGGPSSICRLTY